MGTENMHGRAKAGLKYTVEHWRGGELVETVEAENLIPSEGLQLVSDALFEGATLPAGWFIGLYEADYTPTSAVSAATLNALAVECTTYSETSRPAFVVNSGGVGNVNNVDAKAEFTMSAAKNIYGGFLSSQATKGAPTGVLLSVVKFPTLKAVDSTSILRVTAGFSIISTY